MSSAVEPAREPENAEPTDSATRRRLSRPQRVLVATVLAALLVVGALAAFHIAGKSGTRIRGTGSAARGGHAPDRNLLRLRGMTAAVEARSVQAPLIAGQQVGTLTITKLIPSGTLVKKGDLLVEFDRQAQPGRRTRRRSNRQKMIWRKQSWRCKRLN